MFQTEGLEEAFGFVSFFRFFSGVNKECFILKINRMLCCCFSVSNYSVLNSAELMRRALAPGRKRSLAYPLQKGPDIAGAVAE